MNYQETDQYVGTSYTWNNYLGRSMQRPCNRQAAANYSFFQFQFSDFCYLSQIDFMTIIFLLCGMIIQSTINTGAFSIEIIVVLLVLQKPKLTTIISITLIYYSDEEQTAKILTWPLPSAMSTDLDIPEHDYGLGLGTIILKIVSSLVRSEQWDYFLIFDPESWSDLSFRNIFWY